MGNNIKINNENHNSDNKLDALIHIKENTNLQTENKTIKDRTAKVIRETEIDMGYQSAKMCDQR